MATIGIDIQEDTSWRRERRTKTLATIQQLHAPWSKRHRRGGEDAAPVANLAMRPR